MSRFDTVIIGPVPRRDDGLPDHPDKGCELAPRCLECTLPRCRFDTVNGKQWRRRPKGIPNRRSKLGAIPRPPEKGARRTPTAFIN